MPKRKKDGDDFERLLKKFKKLERKVRRRCRSRSSSSSRYSDPKSNERECLNELLDGNAALPSVASPDPEVVPPEPALVEALRAEPNGPESTGLSVTVPCATDALQENNAQTSTSAESGPPELDSVMLDILGEDPTVQNLFGSEIQKDLAIRLEHMATHGITKEIRKEISDKYLIPINCKLISPPVLNAEIKAAISDMLVKRDKQIELRQKQTANAIACLGAVINKVMLSPKKDEDAATIKMLMDTQRILCDSQHADSLIRRSFILSALKKDMKEQLQKTNIDSFLFGQNLSETIKTAKTINKSGADLKTTVPKPPSNQKRPSASGSKNLNWKGPYPRKPPNHQKTKEHPQNRSRPSTSSRPSQPQPPRGRR